MCFRLDSFGLSFFGKCFHAVACGLVVDYELISNLRLRGVALVFCVYFRVVALVIVCLFLCER